MDKEYLVTKSNYFIMNSSYDLSLEEQKLILTLASMVQPKDEGFKPYIFKISDFMELLGVDTKTKYTEIPKITKELMKKVFEIEEGKKIIQVAWLSSAEYEKGSGEVELQFSPKLKPYMLKLNELYTSYKLANILNMKSKYSPRIYEFLKCNQFKQQGFIQIEVNDLRKLLKAEDIYPKYNDFKRFIILKAQKELKKLTDISFDFEEIKTGRKITSIKFYIHNNIKSNVKAPEVSEETVATSEQYLEEDEVNDQLQTVKNIFDEPITSFEAACILKASNNNIDLIKQKYAIAQQQGNIKNIVAWIIKAIKEDYKEPKTTKQLIPGSASNQRQYDPKELERRLLGRN